MNSQWGGTELSYHLNENKLNLNSSFMNRGSINVKTIASSGVKDISELCVNNLQCSKVNYSFAGARFKVSLSEGSVDDSLQGFSSTSRTSFVHDQGQSCKYASTDPNCKYDQFSSTSYEEIVPVAQGINPSLVDFQKALHNVDTSQVTMISSIFLCIVPCKIRSILLCIYMILSLTKVGLSFTMFNTWIAWKCVILLTVRKYLVVHW